MAKLKINDLPNNTELDTDDSFEISKHNGGSRFSAHINYSDMLSAIEEDLTPIHDLPSTSGLDGEDSFEISKFNGGSRFPAHINYNDMLAVIEGDLDLSSNLNLTDSGSNSNGYYRVYSDGFKEMWGVRTSGIPDDSTTTISFPIAFSNVSSVNVVCKERLNPVSDPAIVLQKTITVNNFRVEAHGTWASSDGENDGIWWSARGY